MTYDEKIKIMLDYLRLKIDAHDWHAVADCAMDLREIEAERRAQPTYHIHTGDGERWTEEII